MSDVDSAEEGVEERLAEPENQQENEPGNMIISCDSTMDISSVEELFHQLESALDTGRIVEFHAQDVERIDTAVLQILVAFVTEAEQIELDVIWKGVSEGMLSTIRNVGVLDFLKVPESAYL